MCNAVHNKYTIDVHCRKIYNLFVRALETGISKSSKQLPNCLQIDDTSVGLIVFIGVICDVSAYTVTVCNST
jgi:hypothetical protein